MVKSMTYIKDNRAIFNLFYKPFILFDDKLKNKYFYIEGMTLSLSTVSFLFF